MRYESQPVLNRSNQLAISAPSELVPWCRIFHGRVPQAAQLKHTILIPTIFVAISITFLEYFFFIFSLFSYTLTWRFRIFPVLFPGEKKAEEWKCWNSYWNNHCLACLLFSAERGIWSGKSKLCKNRRLPNWQIIVDPASRAGKHGKNSRGTRMSFASLGALIIFGYHGFGFLLTVPSVPTTFLKCSCWANFWLSSCPPESRSYMLHCKVLARSLSCPSGQFPA